MRPQLPFISVAIALLFAVPALAEADAPRFDAAQDLSFDSATQSASVAVSTQSRSPNRSANWTGVYIGGQLGFGSVDTSTGGENEDVIGGVTLGYDYDFGQWVLGGALDYDFAEINAGPGAEIEEIFRLKIRGGPKIGNGLLYGAAGWANADTDTLGDDDGWFIGGGYDYMVNSQFSIGGEVLYHDFDSFNGSGNDIEATTVQIRATYRF
ncbi:Opacity protein [Roseovarius tolerans]|uniref:Opacity protein n=1 Tax=Roseovarius tolerans TaxID=74031 RepID=A0A1H8F5N3_9RHOB|nr:outer membrane beta-barrel protein [Roseovarius tolerans]SEN26378.1 Opacity protein [Roseovarius tolerans]